VTQRDPEAAAAALTAAGLERGPDGWSWGGHPWRLRVATPVGIGPDPERLRITLEQQLGVDIEVVPLSAVQWWLSLLGGGHVEATDLALMPVSTRDLYAVFHSRTATAGWANPFDWRDVEIDGWLDAIAQGSATDAAQLMHGRMADLHPALFLWDIEGRAGWRGEPVIEQPGG